MQTIKDRSAFPFLLSIAALTFVLLSAPALAQNPKFDLGKREYLSNCAVCHGLGGKGDGVYKDLLNQRPSDLTVLARENNGVFPHQRVYEIIDGRQEIKVHGPRDMPIWGADYFEKAIPEYTDIPYDPAVYVRARIIALVDYVNRLQVK
jgi:mono/diheme cytochrome c family protein